MCGVAGLINPSGVSAVDVSLMSSAMKHRGPDDHGFMGWRKDSRLRISRDAIEAIQDAEVAFAHRRLSIIDEGEGGRQPMGTADGRFALTFNGEIYNYVELKAELEAEGVSFASHSDTEVLLKALVTWGVEKTLPRLTGMFAFALLDTQASTVTLARDPFGIKPLSFAEVKGGLAFSSELASLLKLSSVDRVVEPAALYDYLRFGFTDRGSRTLFRSIRQLPPAHFAVVDLSAPTRVLAKRYWRAELKQPLDITYDEAATELRRLFMESVALHLRADVPVGAALSGGIDSSTIVGAMRELEGPGLDLHTFTFTVPGSDINEETWADMAAKYVNANVHKVRLSGRELVSEVDGLIATQGEPFGSTSVFAQNRVFRLARDTGIKVTLDGQGADEILAGYVPFLSARLATLMKSGNWGRAFKLFNELDGKGGLIARSMRFILPQCLQGSGRMLVGEQLLPAWMDRDWFGSRGITPQAPQKPISGDVLRHELLQSLTDRVLPSLLRYQDRNSMAHSVESRVPFLTTKLVDFLYSLPEEFLISDSGETKAVFRQAAQGLAPGAILNRRDKIGFAAPEEIWLGEERMWLDDILSGDIMKSIPAFAPSEISREVEALRSGQKSLRGDVWRWINLVRWAELYEVDFQA